MEPALNVFEQSEWVITLLFTAAMTSFLAYIIINSKHSRVRVYYCLGHSLTILLITMNFASKIAADVNAKLLIAVVAYLLKLIFDIIFILYINAFYSPTRRRFHLAAVLVYLILGAVTILTNPSHHLFISEVTQTSITYGSLYYVFMACGLLLEVTGMLCIVSYWVKKLDNQLFRAVASVIAISGMVFLHLSLTNILELEVDFFPLLIAVIFAFYFIGASRYGMFDAISYNSVYGLELFTDAIMITSASNRILYKNKVCELLDEKTLQEIFDSFEFDEENGSPNSGEIKKELELAREDGMRYYTVTLKPVKRRAFSTKKSIYIIHDNTKNISAINLLSEKNQYLLEMNDSTKTMSEDAKKLAILQERNQLANEIHDVVGHALILALNTMESNKLLYDRAAAMRRIRQVVSEIGATMREMETSRRQGAKGAKDTERSAYPRLSERLATLESRLCAAGVDL